MSASHVRQGVATVRPYLYGHADLVDFLAEVFGAKVIEQVGEPPNAHVEARIGDSILALEIGESFRSPTYSSVYVYVEDVDEMYQRALQAGATSVAAPADKPYQERNAGVKDSFGNIWWMAAYTGER